MLLASVFAVLPQVRLTHDLRIPDQELEQIGVSYSLHQGFMAAAPGQVLNLSGETLLNEFSIVDDCILFPSLMDGIHAVRGYSPMNGFVVNGILFWLALLLIAILGDALAGYAGAFAGLLMLVGQPMFCLAATSSDRGLLLAVLGLLGAGMATLHLRLGSKLSQSLLLSVCSLLLLADPSGFVLVLLFLCAMPLAQKYRSGTLDITSLSLLPWFAVPALVLMRSKGWQLPLLWGNSPVALSEGFSWDLFSGNLDRLPFLLFAPVGEGANNLIYSILGVLALVLVLVLMLRSTRSGSPRLGEPALGIALLLGGCLLHVAYALSRPDGQLDGPAQLMRSLTLPLSLACAVLLVMEGLIRKPAARHALVGVLVFAFFMCGLPALQHSPYVSPSQSARETAWKQRLLGQRLMEGSYVIDKAPAFWLVHGISAGGIRRAQVHRDALLFHLRQKTFSSLLLFQSFHVDPRNGKVEVDPSDRVGPEYVLETLEDTRTGVFSLARLSRIVRFRDAGAKDWPAEVVPTEAPAMDSPELVERRKVYMQEFLKRIP